MNDNTPPPANDNDRPTVTLCFPPPYNIPAANDDKPEVMRFFTERTSWEQRETIMSENENGTPPEPPKPEPTQQNVEQGIEQQAEVMQSSDTPTVGGEIPTADHQQAHIRETQSYANQMDGNPIDTPPLTPEFNKSADPPVQPPPSLTPIFNEAANPKDPPTGGPKPQLKPPGGPSGPAPGGGAASLPTNSEQELQSFKDKLRARNEDRNRNRSRDRGR